LLNPSFPKRDTNLKILLAMDEIKKREAYKPPSSMLNDGSYML
jgi:hypothetical protein